MIRKLIYIVLVPAPLLYLLSLLPLFFIGEPTKYQPSRRPDNGKSNQLVR